MISNNFKLQIKTTNFNNIICYEDIDIKILDKLLNSDLLLKTFSDKMRTKLYDNEKTQLLLYRKNYNKDLKKVKVTYTKSKSLNNIGRILPVRSLGLHNIRRQIRHTLAKNKYVDVDIVCCHHELLLQLCKKNNYPTPNLEHYVKNRNVMLNHVMDNYKVDKEKAKNLFIRLLYFGSFNKWSKDNKLVNVKITTELKNFYNELKKIGQKIIENNKDLYLLAEENKKDGKFNALGTTVSYFLQEIECNILMEIYNYSKDKGYILNNNVVLCADGIMIQKKLFDIKLVNELNKYIFDKCGYDLSFKVKEFDEDYLSILDSHIINHENFDAKLYHEVKEIFEKDHFMIEHPLMYGRTYKKGRYLEYGLYNKNEYKDLVKKNKYVYQEIIETEKGIKYKDKDLFDDWIRDTKIRSYNNINFIPKLNNEINIDYFNTFQGFDGEFINDYTNNEKAIELFYKHLSLLTNYNKDSVEYLINYIADIIQNPDKLPSVAIMFKSKQGFGKDLLLDIISRFIGNKYLYRTANLEEIFGGFNPSIKDKIILQLNELEGKDGFSQKEKIKNLITEEFTNINEKNIKQYKQNNYLRIFIMSNNISPLEIPHDDRRFVVFKAHFQKPDKDYFKQLVDLKNNNDDIKTLYEYLKNYKIKLDLRNDRPLTDAYKEMQENCINPIYNYLNELFIRNNIEEYYTFDDGEYKIHKKTGNILIKANDFYQNYKDYLLSQDLDFIKTNFKTIKALLADIGINKKKIKINKENADYYVFNKDKIKEHLKHMDLEEDILEYNDDDFE